MRDKTLIASSSFGPHPANAVAVDASGAVVAVGSGDGTIRVLQVPTLEPIAELKAHDDAVLAVAFDASGGFFVSCGSDGTIRLWS